MKVEECLSTIAVCSVRLILCKPGFWSKTTRDVEWLYINLETIKNQLSSSVNKETNPSNPLFVGNGANFFDLPEEAFVADL